MYIYIYIFLYIYIYMCIEYLGSRESPRGSWLDHWWSRVVPRGSRGGPSRVPGDRQVSGDIPRGAEAFQGASSSKGLSGFAFQSHNCQHRHK